LEAVFGGGKKLGFFPKGFYLARKGIQCSRDRVSETHAPHGFTGHLPEATHHAASEPIERFSLPGGTSKEGGGGFSHGSGFRFGQQILPIIPLRKGFLYLVPLWICSPHTQLETFQQP